MIDYNDFEKVDIRLGEVVSAKEFKEAKKPAYVVEVDFGDKIGIKKSSAQLTKNYDLDELVGMKVACVVNFEPKQIGPIRSEILILGFPDSEGEPVLVTPTKRAVIGERLY